MFKYLLSSLLLLVSATAFGYECNQEIDSLSREYNIPIYCKRSSIYFVSSRISGYQAQNTTIDNFYPALNKFFHVYDKMFLNRNIKQIFLVKSLKYRGDMVGGLSDGSSIYICLDDYSNYQNYRDNIYFHALNHEFSSHILNKMSYTKKIVWRSITHFYNETAEFLSKCLRDTTFSRGVEESLLEKGLLTRYSSTNMENDFNVYAEILFSGDRSIISAKQKYPNVKRKLDILKEVYRDAGFTGKFPDET